MGSHSESKYRPDLFLGLQFVEGPLLRFQLRDGTSGERFEKRLDADPYSQFKDLFAHLEEIGAGEDAHEEDRKRMRREVEGLGATLGAKLLPARLRDRLRSYHVPTRGPDESAPTLLVISAEPWIPWELLRLRDSAGEGPFLAEVFALSRWLWDLPAPLALPLKRIGLVVSARSGLPKAPIERKIVHELEEDGAREVEDVRASLNAVLDGFAAGRFTGWHFAGHGWTKEENPDLWNVTLNDDGEALKALDLDAPGCDLRGQRPLVFLNACRSARANLALSGAGGLAQAFLEAGAGAVVGTHWSIVDRCAPDFARAFYRFFLQGKPIAEAARQARLWLREEFPGDPTWLAYTLFAHPRAAVDGPEELIPLPRCEERFLEVPWDVWRPDRSPPGALLRADHRIVPFHSRERELEELFEWCGDERPVRVRLYTGSGGMGKTRLSLELCHRLRDQGWRTGFVKSAADASPEEAAHSLIAGGGPMLAVVDYAETRRGFLLPLLRELLDAEDDGPFRLILLSRWREDWWEQLKASPDGIGDLIAGPATSHHALAPLALLTDDRAATYHKAAKAFAGRLERPVPEGLPEDIEAKYFEPVLMLHMSALGAVEGVPLKGEDGILDWVLNRERMIWRTQLTARELALNLMPGVGRAMSAITLAGGAVSEEGTVQLLESLRFFKGQPVAVLTDVAHLMHDTYPGERWIMPVQPDILGEHLIERELVDDPQEIFDLVLGPRTEESATEIGTES